MQSSSEFSDKSSFVYREHELNNGVSFLLPEEEERCESRVLMLSGDSGTGKTTLCRKLLQHVRMSGVDGLIVYLDLLNDEFITASLFESLISLSWNQYSSTDTGDLLKV